jgi:hypothetical protein
VAAAPTPGNRPHTHPQTTNLHKAGVCDSSGGPRQCGGDTIAAQLRRRRSDSWRLPRLECGRSDPVRPWRPETLSQRQIDGAVAAAEHLGALGYPPIFDTETLRALRRAG